MNWFFTMFPPLLLWKYYSLMNNHFKIRKNIKIVLNIKFPPQKSSKKFGEKYLNYWSFKNSNNDYAIKN